MLTCGRRSFPYTVIRRTMIQDGPIEHDIDVHTGALLMLSKLHEQREHLQARIDAVDRQIEIQSEIVKRNKPAKPADD
jgi:hypothetical protein